MQIAASGAMVRWDQTPISEELSTAVDEASKQSVRAFQVGSAPKRPRCVIEKTLPASPSLAADLVAVNELFVEPCVVMVRLVDENKTVADADELDWALLCFMPEEAGTQKKLKAEGLHRSLETYFTALKIRSVRFVTKFDDLAKAIIERARPRSLSVTERFAAEESDIRKNMERKMTDIEDQAERVKFAIGLVSLQVEPQESFRMALGLIMQEKKGTIVVRLEGEDHKDMVGEVLDDVLRLPQVADHVSEDAPCYYVNYGKVDDGDDRLCVVTWLPEAADPRLNVIFSSTKVSVLSALVATAREADVELTQADAHVKDEFADLQTLDVEVAEVQEQARKVLNKQTSQVTVQSAVSGALNKKRKPKYRRSTYIAQRASVIAAQVPPQAAGP